MNVLVGFSPSARALIVAAAIAILVIFLQLAAPIIAPMLLAVFIAIVATPLLRWMRRFGMPKWAALAFIVFVFLDVGSWLEGVGMAGSREAVPDIFDPMKVTALVRVVLSNVSGIFATGLLILLAVVFMLLEAPSLPAKLKTAFHFTEESEARVRHKILLQ